LDVWLASTQVQTGSTVLSFEPDRELLVQAMARHLWPRKSARLLMLLGAFLVGVGVFSLFYVETRVNDVIAGIGLTFGLLMLYAQSPWGFRKQVRGMIQRTPALTAPREVIATADGLRVITATADLRLAWSHYQSVASDELGMMVIQRGSTAGQFVPRRAFADASEESAWAERVSAWVAEAAPD
jgi:hypothetical protein